MMNKFEVEPVAADPDNAMLSMQDVIELLCQRAAERPTEPFLIWEPPDGMPRQWTRAQLLESVVALAGRLARKGVDPGSVVLLYGDNSPELIMSWFACAWLGATAALINPKSTARELDEFADRLQAVGLIWQQGLPADPASLKADLRWHLPMAVVSEPSDAGVDRVPAARMPGQSAAFMMFTSGTSSRPKAVVWSRDNLAWAAVSGARVTTMRADDVILLFLPLYHVVGLAWTLLPALQAGARVVLMPRFSLTRFWPVALKTRATFAAHVQFSTAALFSQPVPEHGFRLWCNSTWLPRYEAHFRVPIIGWWGMTELVSPGIAGRPGRGQAPGTIGSAVDGYRLRIAGGARDGLVPGEVGDLQVQGVRGRTIFSGYHRDPAADAAAFTADGWFLTGDRVRVHDDGSIQFLERSRDVIKTGGEGVSPAEVERVIGEVEGISQASVVGRPDDVLGEVGIAFVVLQSSVTDPGAVVRAVQRHCAESLAKFKRPHEIRVVEDLPRVGINKVAKGELRRLALTPPEADPTSHA